MSKAPNAFLCYRNDEIDLNQERTMVEHSRITGPRWNELDDQEKRKYYHLAEKAKIRKEAESGKNLETEKRFVQGDDYSFIIETPSPKKRTRNHHGKKSKKLPRLQSAEVQQPREDLNVISNEHSIQLSDKKPLKNLLVEDDKNDLFNEFTIGTDYDPHEDFINKGALPTQTFLKNPSLTDDFINQGALPPSTI